MAPEAADATLSEEIRWTTIAENQSAESRHGRFATVAYYTSEARGFEPGHEAQDWLLAQVDNRRFRREPILTRR